MSPIKINAEPAVAIIIPARYASTRYPGKPLVKLKGATGIEKTLVQRTWEAGKKVVHQNHIFVATDDDRIRREVQSFGGNVIMTSSDCRNGTERCAEAANKIGNIYDIYINLQGDAPLTPYWFVEELISKLTHNYHINVATPVLRCSSSVLRDLKDDRQNGRVGGTTAVFDTDKNALFFSKEVIPYTNREFSDNDVIPVFHHVGVYGYRKQSLNQYVELGEGVYEKHEGLEQLRFLENGIPVTCVEVDARGHHFWELNNPTDVEKIEKMMLEMGID